MGQKQRGHQTHPPAYYNNFGPPSSPRGTGFGQIIKRTREKRVPEWSLTAPAWLSPWGFFKRGHERS